MLLAPALLMHEGKKLHEDLKKVCSPLLTLEVIAIDIGRPSRAFPVTPPYIRIAYTAVRLIIEHCVNKRTLLSYMA
jgi:hypothetical protein